MLARRKRLRPRSRSPCRSSVGGTAPDWLMYAGVGALGLGLLMGLPDAGTGQAQAADGRRADRHVRRGRSASPLHRPGRRGRCDHRHAGGRGAARAQPRLDARITHRLEGAGSELKSSEWLLLHAAVFHRPRRVRVLIGRAACRRAGVPRPRRRGPVGLPRAPTGAPQEGFPRRTPRHPPADLGFAGRRALARAVDGHRGPRGHRASGVGVQAGADRDPAGRPARGALPESPSGSRARTSNGW